VPAQLGGHSIYFGPETGKLGEREPLRDFAKVSARYLDALVLRTFRHETITEVARFSEKPVINALSEERHPCQALGDLLTIQEKIGKLEGAKITFLGDANNVCKSLAVAAFKVGAQLTVASPPGHGLSASFLRLPVFTEGVGPKQTDDVQEAVKGADVLYTDVWLIFYSCPPKTGVWIMQVLVL
jgi:ornithine carbamoyltransferase